MNALQEKIITKGEMMGHVSVLEQAQDLSFARPLLKWAGGKTQLLGEILPEDPKKIWSVHRAFFRWRSGVFCSTARKWNHCR